MIAEKHIITQTLTHMPDRRSRPNAQGQDNAFGLLARTNNGWEQARCCTALAVLEGGIARGDGACLVDFLHVVKLPNSFEVDQFANATLSERAAS
jgi:hypothetical protein